MTLKRNISKNMDTNLLKHSLRCSLYIARNRKVSSAKNRDSSKYLKKDEDKTNEKRGHLFV